MARIVGVHGIAQQYRGGPELTQQWLLDIRAGLEAAGFRSTADGLADSDVRVAFYGDLFRPPGTMSTGAPPYTVVDLGRDETELLSVLYDEAVRCQPELGPPPGVMKGSRPLPHVMLDRVLQSRALSGLAKHLLIDDLKQVNAYLDDHDQRQAVLDRLAGEMSEDVEVIIGHSLGSVVAYEFCCQAPTTGVKLFVTLGSPLGIPRLIFDRLQPPPTNGRGSWPQRIPRWVNVADRNDIVALRKELASMFERGPDDAQVEDRLVDNGEKPHAGGPYLNSRQTGEALGAALGE